MFQFLKRFWWIGWMITGVPSAWGFALIGPSAGYPGVPPGFGDTWQVPDLGFNPLPYDGLATGPKNLGEEYRRNTPVMYYTFDANFLDYFGSNGVYAVEQAFAILNSLTNVSSYSADLSEFPLEAESVNYQAEGLGLTDLKSMTMALMMEQLGLAEPVRYIWNEHNRVSPPGAPPCPVGMDYLIVQRNFDPIPSAPNQLQISSYVNGTLYSYGIRELCTTPIPPVSEAVEFSVDPTANTFTAIADKPHRLDSGLFFTSLTRDDIGGFRYLLGTNNMNVESSGPGTSTFVTNTTSQLAISSNLTLFAAQALTNDAAALQTLYPGLIVTSSTNTFVNVWATNLIAYFTNYPFDPVGTPPHTAFRTNVTVSIQTQFHHTFANLLSVQPSGGGFIAVPLTQIPPPGLGFVTTVVTNIGVTNYPWAPAGTFAEVTNVSFKTYLTNEVVGEFLILTNGLCGEAIIASQLTNVVALTSVQTTATNVSNGTNLSLFSQSLVTYFTNHAFVVYPITCPTNTVGLRQGIEKMTFVRRDFDSLLNRFFYPITNEYTLIAVTNNSLLRQRTRREVTTPDFLFSAFDQAPGPAVFPFLVNGYVRNLTFNLGNEYPNLSGPGTIEAPTTISFNKVGPLYENPLFFASVPYAEPSQVLLQAWGSFDGTTNAPIVYPNGTSIRDLQTQILVQVTPLYLAEGRVGSAYSQDLQAQSSTPTFEPPFSWTLAPGSAALPPGLHITTSGGNGLISGTANQEGFFDFVIRITDDQGRTIDRSYAIKINP